MIGFPINKIAKDHLGGWSTQSNSHSMLAICSACNILPKINCLGFMVVSLQLQRESCRQTFEYEAAIKF